MKNIVWLWVVVLITGCAVKVEKNYILSSQTVPVTEVREYNQTVGIKSIELPQYLLQKNIAVLRNGNELHYLPDQFWAVSMDEQLTGRVVSTLQKALHSPNINQYPWNTQQDADQIVQIIVNQFIADEKSVILDATWYIIDTKTKKQTSGFFRKKIAITDKKEVVKGMNRLFTVFEGELVKALL